MQHLRQCTFYAVTYFNHHKTKAVQPALEIIPEREEITDNNENPIRGDNSDSVDTKITVYRHFFDKKYVRSYFAKAGSIFLLEKVDKEYIIYL